MLKLLNSALVLALFQASVFIGSVVADPSSSSFSLKKSNTFSFPNTARRPFVFIRPTWKQQQEASCDTIQQIRGGNEPSSRSVIVPGKVHSWFGTSPILHPLLYPILDATTQIALLSLSLFCLTGTAKTTQLTLLGVHLPLYLLTDFGAKFLFLPRLIPMKVMYTFDIGLILFYIISPFFMDGYGALKWLFVFGFGVAGGLIGLFDPKPNSGD